MLLLLGCKKESMTEPVVDTERGLVQVMGGTFQMGSTSGSPLELPVHWVTLEGFYIDRTEITYELWTEIRNWGLTHGYTDLPTGTNGYNPIGTNNPVTEVSWYDIVKWCNARSEKQGLTPVYYTSNSLSTVCRTRQLDISADAVKWTASGYRMPTEAEWEFAARGGTKSQGYKYSGSNSIDSVAWWVLNSGNDTHPVSTRGANELGMVDMSGNVWEWCWDWYDSYGTSAQADPKGPVSGTSKLIRGGSCWSGWMNSTLTFRAYIGPSTSDSEVGFRCVRR